MPIFDVDSKSKVDDNLSSYVTTDYSTNTKDIRIMVYGQPKVGKTTTAMTVSEFWPGEIPAKTPVVLEDVFSIAVDRNANIGLRTAGIRVPEFNVRELLTSGKLKTIRDALRKAAEVAHLWVTTKGVKTVIVDTVSMIDFELGKYWTRPENYPMTERNEPDRYGVYREILNSHGVFWQDIDFLPARIIFLCHADVNAESVKPKQNDRDKARLQVSTLAGTETDIKPLITGKAGDLYMRNVDLILPMRMTGESAGTCTRSFLPYGGLGMSGGNRFHFILNEEEPAHLGKLLCKIESNAINNQ